MPSGWVFQSVACHKMRIRLKTTKLIKKNLNKKLKLLTTQIQLWWALINWTLNGSDQPNDWCGLKTKPTSFLIHLFKSAEEFLECLRSNEVVLECPGVHALAGSCTVLDETPLPLYVTLRSHDEFLECPCLGRFDDDVEVDGIVVVVEFVVFVSAVVLNSGTRTIEPGLAFICEVVEQLAPESSDEVEEVDPAWNCDEFVVGALLNSWIGMSEKLGKCQQQQQPALIYYLLGAERHP